MTKADKQQQEKYKGKIVPMNEIESNAKTLRPMSEITDAQAELVHMMLHDGCNPTEASKRLGRNKAWAYKTIVKQHVIDYRQKLSMMTLGWDATQALATMRELLQAPSNYIRLEASKDLMDRAGLKVEPVRSANSNVSINFNID
tara:strand:- start:465 stop:896 length:432 start_codon:yes stop_codon:yes gene_type:complete